MSGRGDKKSKRRRRDKDRDNDNDDDGVVRKSLIDYSKVADRHVDDARYETHRQSRTTPSANPAASAAAATSADGQQPKVSSQMNAVMRLMAGMEERTISEKLADSNRPTWEQYKKDNADKLDISGVDQKKMDAYRKELDEQRDKLLTRGRNHQNEGEKDNDKKASKKKKKRKHRRHDDSYSSESDSSDYSSSSDDGRKRKRKKHKKSRDDRKRSSSKHKKKKDKKSRKKGDDDGSSSGGDSYRLSSFFGKGSDDEDSK